MTGYVVTRWYRAPEVIFNWMHYSQTGSNFLFRQFYFQFTNNIAEHQSIVVGFSLNIKIKFCLPTLLTVDIWSAACILVEMITGKVLFPGHDSILTHAAHFVMKIHVGL